MDFWREGQLTSAARRDQGPSAATSDETKQREGFTLVDVGCTTARLQKVKEVVSIGHFGKIRRWIFMRRQTKGIYATTVRLAVEE